MAYAKIPSQHLSRAVQNALDGLVKRIIEDETQKAKDAIQARIAAETHGFVAKVVSDNSDYTFNHEVNVVISFPEATA